MLEDGLPAWTYALGDALLEVSLAMPHGADAIAVALRVVRARGAIALTGRLVVADRDHHGGPLPRSGSGSRRRRSPATARRVVLPACGRTLHAYAPGAQIDAAREVYAGFALPRETERGLQDVDDYLHVLTFAWELDQQRDGGVVLSLDPDVPRDAHAIVEARRAANRARAKAQPTPLLGSRSRFARRRDSSSHAWRAAQIAERRERHDRSPAIRGSPTGAATR